MDAVGACDVGLRRIHGTIVAAIVAASDRIDRRGDGRGDDRPVYIRPITVEVKPPRQVDGSVLQL